MQPRLFLSAFHRLAAILFPLAGAAIPAQAADKLVVLTSWFAQAEHGGLYQAEATGLYERAGLDVTIKMGGPQINSMQLVLAGEADVYSGFDFQTLNAVHKGLPVVTIAAQFQHDPQGLVTHPDVASLAALKDRTILLAAASRVSWWPWLKARYGLSDQQTKPYTFNPQPFVLDAKAVEQGYPSSEPFGLQRQGVPYRFFLFSDQGYPPYGGSLVTRRDLLTTKPDVLRRFARATMEGWKSYLADPAPGNALIKAANPKMSDAQLAFAVDALRKLDVVGGGDAAREGIGAMTEARWKAIYDFMVAAGLLDPATDWRKAFTTAITDHLGVMPK
jgi:NitT/TauT family transport system substrate-binding protein